MHMGNQYLFAAAGGMFLYIALVDMVPEMNATMDQMSKVSVKKAMLVFLLQNIGIMSGIVSLFVLAKFQDDIQIQLWSFFWMDSNIFLWWFNISSQIIGDFMLQPR